jgi:osmotically-inducible protein OsmY
VSAFLICAVEANAKADNSKNNQSILNRSAATAESQGTSKKDIEITRKIRESLMSRDDLSHYAQNVKVITLDGVVTLKGPVQSKTEQDIVAKCAENVVGKLKVNNELEIVRAE